MASWASPSQFLERFDYRTVGQLVNDVGVQVSAPELLTHPVLQAALDDASGEIEAALLQGKRYTLAQLAALTGNSAKYLARLTCEIAMSLLYGRRPYADNEARLEAIKRGNDALEHLRCGHHVFDIEDVKDAGLPSITGPTRVQLQSLNMVVDRVRPNYYPVRVLPFNR